MPGGTIYLLHLSEPYAHARHYTGVAFGGGRGLRRRLKQHGTKEGSPLLLAARRAGITWTLARTWAGGRVRERQLKRQGGASRRCPLCGIQPRRVHADLQWNRDGSLSRLLTPDWQKAAIGVMTSRELAEHTRLRKGAAVGRIVGIERHQGTPGDDPWYVMTVT